MNIIKREIILQNKILYFAFQLTRKEFTEIYKLENQLSDLLFSIKTYLYVSENKEEVNKYLFFLKTLYKLIAYTRDIYIGKGERDLTYMMLTVWYKYYPKYAIQMFSTLCSSCNMGTWKDMKYLCHYIQHKTKIIYDDKKEIWIQKIIRMVNQQLLNDLYIQNMELFTPLPDNNENPKKISNISKWIPREKSKFHTIFERCVKDWIENTTENPEQRNRDRKKYRQILSYLNRKIDTTQIKQCAKTPDTILYTTVSIQTKIRNENYFEKYTPTLQSKLSTPSLVTSSKTIPKYNYFLGEIMEKNNNQTNKIWMEIRHQLTNTNINIQLLPFLDINTENQRDATAIAIMISEISKIEEKIMLYNRKRGIWVNFLSHSLSPVSTDTKIQINRIEQEKETFAKKKKEIEKNRLSSIFYPENISEEIEIYPTIPEKKSIELLIESFIHTNTSPEKIENLVLVFISDFQYIPKDHYSILKSIFYKHKIFKIPKIVYWNISLKVVNQLPCAYNTPNVCFVSGTNSQNIHHLLEYLQLQNKIQKSITPIDYLYYEINREKYDLFDNHFIE